MMSGQPWVLASRNAGKLRELRALFATHRISVIDLNDVGIAEDHDAEEAIEAFDTFEENALAKARHFSRLLPGRVVVADDSGLSVDALGGAPGVRSKRWSGAIGFSGRALDASNNAKLMAQLVGVEDRRARFVCAAAWTDGAREQVVRGEVVGHIGEQPQGDHGFGYDPYFFVDELGMTMAEATVPEKEVVSHRGRAFVALLGAVREFVGA
jgi:XTP/dITP diphosphohydrolase